MSFGDENRVNRPHIRKASLRRCVAKRGGLEKEEGKPSHLRSEDGFRRSSGSVNFSVLKVNQLAVVVNPQGDLVRENLGCQALIHIPSGHGSSSHLSVLQP